MEEREEEVEDSPPPLSLTFGWERERRGFTKRYHN